MKSLKTLKKSCQILAKCTTQLEATQSKLGQAETRRKSVDFGAKARQNNMQQAPAKRRKNLYEENS